MPDNFQGSGTPGSSVSVGPNLNELPQNPGAGVGEPKIDMVPKSMYDELFTKFGAQGNEVGEYRKFIEDITPLLDKLEKDPSIAKAILDEKFTPEMATAILENKISIQDAQIIEKANQEVKKELGNAGYEATSVQEISKMIDEKTKALRDEIASRDELRTFEERVNDFIANTNDFSEYADSVLEWLDEHPENQDIETAYFAVKGKLSVKEAAKAAAMSQTEEMKNVALNAGGGGGQATYIRRDMPLVDQLIAPRSDPNNFG